MTHRSRHIKLSHVQHAANPGRLEGEKVLPLDSVNCVNQSPVPIVAGP